ncbi:RIP metalloprotease RseP [Candidatus Wolfebacteria bacterium]|nr:RIP metalloprotease RseP [Candidatus Wolfebacteria bacterium]
MFLGIIFVIIFLSILIVAHELGHFLAAKRFGLLVEEFGFGLPSKKLWSKKIGETLYSINLLPFGGFVKIFGEDGQNLNELPEDQKRRSFASLKIWQRTIIISAGVIFNFLLGWLVISSIFFIGAPKAILITDVVKNSPAESAGIKTNDKIIGFENSKDVINLINENRGKEIELKIERPGKITKETLNIKITPRTSENTPKGQGALGIGLTDAGFEKKGLITSFWEGLKTSFELSLMIFKAIFGLLVKTFSGQATLDSVSGPVGIIKITAQAGELGFIYLFQLLAMISLNLAALNIFPFPALDGGRLVFLAIEKIKGSPIKPKTEQIINSLGLAFLLLLMIAITIKDIAKF